MRPKKLGILLLYPNLSKASLFTPFQEFTISLKYFFTSSHPNRGRPDFRLALDCWPKRTIFGNLSSFIHRTGPSHLNHSHIIALETGLEPHFSYSQLFEIRSVKRVPKTIRRQLLWKTYSHFFSPSFSQQIFLCFSEHPSLRSIFDNYFFSFFFFFFFIVGLV